MYQLGIGGIKNENEKKMKKLAIPLGRPCANTNCLQHEGGLVYNNLAPQGKPGGFV